MDERPKYKRPKMRYWDTDGGLLRRHHEGKEFAHQVASLVATARETFGEMTVASFHVLLIVAAQPNLSVKEIAWAAGLSEAGASRILDTLGYRKRNGEPGLGLVEGIIMLALDKRRHHYHLSQKGEEAVWEWSRAYHDRKTSRYYALVKKAAPVTG
jgi:DNA-binding MarR family transcriptional regulator